MSHVLRMERHWLQSNNEIHAPMSACYVCQRFTAKDPKRSPLWMTIDELLELRGHCHKEVETRPVNALDNCAAFTCDSELTERPVLQRLELVYMRKAKIEAVKAERDARQKLREEQAKSKALRAQLRELKAQTKAGK